MRFRRQTARLVAVAAIVAVLCGEITSTRAFFLDPADGPVNNFVLDYHAQFSSNINGVPAFGVSADAFGSAIVACDLDGDGVSEILAGADHHLSNIGRLWIFGVTTDVEVVRSAVIGPADMGLGLVASDYFGASLVCPPDNDPLDGLRTVGVGSDGYGIGGAFLWITINGTSWEYVSHTTIDASIVPEIGANEGFGIGAAFIGDVDGNGADDLGVSSYSKLTILFMDSNRSVIARTRISETDNKVPGVDLTIPARRVAGIGDLDGDSVPDIILGASTRGTGGSVIVVFLNRNGTAKAGVEILGDDDVFGGGSFAGASFGAFLENVGDIDGDGLDEIAVGATQWDWPASDVGGFVVFSLARNATVRWSIPFGEFQNGVSNSLQAGCRFGATIAVLGDITGDGFTEIGVSAESFDGDMSNQGAFFVYSLPAFHRDSVGFQADPIPTNSLFGFGYSTMFPSSSSINVTFAFYDNATGDYFGSVVESFSPMPGAMVVDVLSWALPPLPVGTWLAVMKIADVTAADGHPIVILPTFNNSNTVAVCTAPPDPISPFFTVNPGGVGALVGWTPTPAVGGCSGAPSFSATYSVDGGVATTVVTTGASVDIGLDRQHANISLDVVVVNGAGLAGPSNPGLLYLLAESTEPLNVCGWTRNGFVPPTLDVVLTWDMPQYDGGDANYTFAVARNDSTIATGVTDTTFTDVGRPEGENVIYTVVANNLYGSSLPGIALSTAFPFASTTALTYDAAMEALTFNVTVLPSCHTGIVTRVVLVASDPSFTTVVWGTALADSGSTAIAVPAAAWDGIYTLYLQTVFGTSDGPMSTPERTLEFTAPDAPSTVDVSISPSGDALEITWSDVARPAGDIPITGWRIEVGPDATLDNNVVTVVRPHSAGLGYSLPLAVLMSSWTEVHVRVGSTWPVTGLAFSATVKFTLPTIPPSTTRVPTTTVSPLVPQPVPWVNATMVDPRTIVVTWGAPANTAAVGMYLVEWGIPGDITGSGGTERVVNDPSAASMSVSLRGVESDTSYFIGVFAVSNDLPSTPLFVLVSTLWPRFDALLPQPAVSLGGGLVVLTGSGFEMGLRIFLDGMPLNETLFTWVDEGVVDILAPARPSHGYVNILLVNPNGARLTVEGQLYYAGTDCLAEGFFAANDDDGGGDNECIACPEHAICPGGGRAWPEAGYWTPDETSGSIMPCTPSFKCLGGRSSSCSDGYTGFACSGCDETHYYTDGFCMECDSPGVTIVVNIVDVMVYVVGTILMLAGPMGLLRRMSFWMIVLQFARVLGSSGQGLFNASVAVTVRGLAVTTGEGLRQASPCGVHEHAFAHQYGTQLTVMYGVIVVQSLVFGAVIGLAECVGSQARRGERRRWWVNRFINGTTIAMTGTHAGAVSLALRALVCTSTSEGPVLLADSSVACWEGSHVWMFVVAVVVILAHGICLPLLFYYLLRRNRVSLHQSDDLKQRYGFLFEMFTERDPYFFVSWLAFDLVLLMVIKVFQSALVLSFAVASVVVLAYAGFVSVRRPFRRALWNVAFTLLVFVGLLIILLTILGESADDTFVINVISTVVLAATGAFLILTVLNVSRPVDSDDDLVALLPNGAPRSDISGVGKGRIRRMSYANGQYLVEDWSSSSLPSSVSSELRPWLGDDDDADLYVVRHEGEAEALEMDILQESAAHIRAIPRPGDTGSDEAGLERLIELQKQAGRLARARKRSKAKRQHPPSSISQAAGRSVRKTTSFRHRQSSVSGRKAGTGNSDRTRMGKLTKSDRAHGAMSREAPSESAAEATSTRKRKGRGSRSSRSARSRKAASSAPRASRNAMTMAGGGNASERAPGSRRSKTGRSSRQVSLRRGGASVREAKKDKGKKKGTTRRKVASERTLTRAAVVNQGRESDRP